MESKNKPNWMIVVVFILVCILIAAVISGIWCEKLKINENNVIIGFIGVLATFVVIGNYAQTADMRDRTESKIKELERQLKEAKKQLGDAKKVNDGLSETLEKFQKEYDTVIKTDLVRIINGKGGPGQSGAFVKNKKISDIIEIRTEDGREYVVKFSDEVFIVDIVEEKVIR